MRTLKFPTVAAALAVALAGGAQAQSRTTLLHDALHLDSRQEDSWRAFQANVAPDPQAQAQARQTAAMAPGLPTPRRLALIRAQMQADLAGFDRTARAVEGFYATLSPAQQAVFDRQTASQGDQPGAQPRSPGR